jgi:pimeloyl-ACP methyl ester carboxylesterase
MLEFIKKEKKKNVVVFVHGFTGGKETWVDKNGIMRIPDYLMADKELADNTDFTFFHYFTKVTDKFEKVSWFLSLLYGRRKLKKNLAIDDLSDIFLSEVQIKLKDYDNIFIVAHSMGGLVTKDMILKSKTNQVNNNIKLFASLAVPHNGANLANIAKAIFNNPHIKDLAPLEPFINSVTQRWLTTSALPYTLYFQGKGDTVVPKTSSVGFENVMPQPIYTDDTHSSILTPQDENSIIVLAIRDYILVQIRTINRQLNRNSNNTKSITNEDRQKIYFEISYLEEKRQELKEKNEIHKSIQIEKKIEDLKEKLNT